MQNIMHVQNLSSRSQQLCLFSEGAIQEELERTLKETVEDADGCLDTSTLKA